MAKIGEYIRIEDLYINNKRHDTILENTLSKTEFKDIDGLIKYFNKNIDCILVEEYIQKMDNSLKGIVLKSSISALQNNYKANLELILSKKTKTTFWEYKKIIDSKKDDGIDIGIKPISILIQKGNSKEDIIKILETYGQDLKYLDEKIFESISKSYLEINNIIEIFNNYLDTTNIKLNKNTIITLLKKSSQQREKNIIINKYLNESEIDIDIYNEIIDNTSNIKKSLDLLDKYGLNLKVNIKSINILLKQSNNNEKDLIKILEMLPLGQFGNNKTLSILLYNINRLEDLPKFSSFISLSSINKDKLKKDYFILKIMSKFGFTNIDDFLLNIENELKGKNIDEKEITEDNWMNFLEK